MCTQNQGCVCIPTLRHMCQVYSYVTIRPIGDGCLLRWECSIACPYHSRFIQKAYRNPTQAPFAPPDYTVEAQLQVYSATVLWSPYRTYITNGPGTYYTGNWDAARTCPSLQTVIAPSCNGFDGTGYLNANPVRMLQIIVLVSVCCYWLLAFHSSLLLLLQF